MTTKLLLVGVDGLDFDVVSKLGTAQLPALGPIIESSAPHTSTFPPDSVPSWTSIFTGRPPSAHGKLHSKNYILDDPEFEPEVGIADERDRCFWMALPQSATCAIINPFLAYPPFALGPNHAMVSAPSFREGDALVVDPSGLLVGTPPRRMGGFTAIPSQRKIASFVDETMSIAEAQYDYTLRQVSSGHFDMVFHTNLTVDRIEHFAWRHCDPNDFRRPWRASVPAAVSEAYQQLDTFLCNAIAAAAPNVQVRIFSDHGHGPRASIGVNFVELFRRHGLFCVETTTKRRVIEAAKTWVLSIAPRMHLEGPVISLAKRVPSKKQMKSGSYVGAPKGRSLRVPDVAGSNPFGGIDASGDLGLQKAAIDLLMSLRYRDVGVVRWVRPTEDVLGATSGHFPDLLFELHPNFAPTWNLYGPVFAPIITRRRLSGGHTQRGVYAALPPTDVRPLDSVGVHCALRDACGSL